MESMQQRSRDLLLLSGTVDAGGGDPRLSLEELKSAVERGLNQASQITTIPGATARYFCFQCGGCNRVLSQRFCTVCRGQDSGTTTQQAISLRRVWQAGRLLTGGLPMFGLGTGDGDFLELSFCFSAVRATEASTSWVALLDLSLIHI